MEVIEQSRGVLEPCQILMVKRFSENIKWPLAVNYF